MYATILFRVLLCWFGLTVTFISLDSYAEGSSKRKSKMSYNKHTIDIPTLNARLIFSYPAYLSAELDEIPYQFLQLCYNQNKQCNTIEDMRGTGNGISIAPEGVMFSKDYLYMVLSRPINIDSKKKTYSRAYYEIYGLREGRTVAFRTDKTPQSRTASTDNILEWSQEHPHVLVLVKSWTENELAYLWGDDGSEDDADQTIHPAEGKK